MFVFVNLFYDISDYNPYDYSLCNLIYDKIKYHYAAHTIF